MDRLYTLNPPTGGAIKLFNYLKSLNQFQCIVSFVVAFVDRPITKMDRLYTLNPPTLGAIKFPNHLKPFN